MSTTTRFEKLFQPIHLGQMEIKNRIVMAPMLTNSATRDGFVTEQTKAHYAERAQGGAGLIIVEEACIDPIGKGGALQLYIDSDRHIPGLSELARTIQNYGVKAAIQLHHAGRLAATRLTGCQPVGPSAIPHPGRDIPRELSLAEIEAVVDKYTEAAGRAYDAGFDGIEIQAVADFLFTEFLSPDSNKRQDAFGGDLRNRARLLLDVVTAVRDRVGSSYPVWVRLTAQQFHISNGVMIEESKQVARWLEETGVVALNVSADYFQSSLRMPWKVEGESLPRPPSAHPHGFLIPLISQIKQVVDIPVMGVGWLDLETGERALWEGKIDMAVIGRPLLADPEIPDKATSGRLDDIRPCIGCLMCQTNIDDGVFCTVNASVGRNFDYPITQAKGKKRVIVVGGGPSGLEAARIAALRGHEVVLYEKSEGLGGQLLIASLPPHKEILAELVNYLTTQMCKLGVKVELGIEVTPELILGAEPDVVIVAAGITPCVLDIPGAGRAEVVDFKDVLTGGRDTGDAVVIIGGGVTGCETGEFLAYKNKRVTIVEMLEDIATGMEPRHKQYLLERLDALGVTVLKKTRAKAVQEDGLAVTMEDGKERVLTAETIVLATGSRPNQELYRQLVGKVPEIYQAGDCAEPRRIFEAIADGFLISQAI